MTAALRAREDVTVDFDVYDAGLAAPVDRFQERAAELAAIGPVVWSPLYGGHWIVTGYEEVHEVLRDAETYSSFPNNLITSDAFGKFIPIELDPPEHTGYRKALQPLFGPARMKKLTDDIRLVVNDLLSEFSSRGSAEYVSEFAHELPARIFLTLMDWPVEDAPLFTTQTDVALLGKPGASEEESMQARAEAAMQMFAYFQKMVDERRANPGDDITSTLIHTEVAMEDGLRLLTDEELDRMFFLLLIAGLHTVQGSLAWMIKHFIANPEQRQQIIDDPDLIPSAVEEILRIEAAVVPGRRAIRDVELGGVQIAAGDKIILILASANRDPREFETPADVDVNRSPNRHLSFGGGPHRCLGSHLARIELAVAMEVIHARIPDYRFVESDPPVFQASQVRGCLRMPIEFTPES
ncbi:cytochrome P450 [Gordonia humi]|uniref:Cytochrome P450 n=1 Tax=Gordonia humi TaxID=686429 RepID=A0A840F6C8_9ACTN|nr:cytochrome P450 [Gordonia humi]MBB4137446.1 cytochrome P450 [Gordonia humi]